MRDLRTLTGEWRGFSLRGKQRNTISAHLCFAEYLVEGSGSDVGGEFKLRGDYFAAERRLMMERSYSDLTVLMDGRWDGRLISGYWGYKIVRVTAEGVEHREERGTFELWPLEEEHSLGYRFQPKALPENASENEAE